MPQRPNLPPHWIPYQPAGIDDDTARSRGAAFERFMETRRSVRFFADRPVPRDLIECAIRTASSAPSGAHRQPWTFVAVSDPAVKRRIRIAAEEEEKAFYEGRAPKEWLEALAPIGTTWEKPFLETVPWIVVVFEQVYGSAPDGTRVKNYYVRESVGIACGLFITSLHQMGLSTLTHTPNPMTFLNRLLGRPRNEKPFILFPVGHAAPDAVVPDLRRKPLGEVATFDPVVKAGT